MNINWAMNSSNEEFDNQLINNINNEKITKMDWTINISGSNPKQENQITINSIKEHFPDAEVVNEDDNIQNGG